MSLPAEPLALALALLAGVAIAAACGLRAFLPLLVLGLAARFAGIELAPAARWLASDAALIGLATATVLEILADKIPVVDHALDAVATVIRPAAAALASYGLLVHWPAPWAQILALLLGGTALMLHAAKAKTRLASSLVTVGLANPWISLAEDVITVALVVAAFLAPLLAGLLLVLLGAALVRSWRRSPRGGPA